MIALQPAIGSTLELSESAQMMRKVLERYHIPLYMSNVPGQGDRSDILYSFDAHVEDI
ncbi:MAG: hypothetical protein H6765_02695 [Candidatus Peribacteria bacterium]|nr:MAG: hypothetical protein H6765_02695 [Candidatus Peribacteria bacterium]